jgi:hypothetical protein
MFTIESGQTANATPTPNAIPAFNNSQKLDRSTVETIDNRLNVIEESDSDNQK